MLNLAQKPTAINQITNIAFGFGFSPTLEPMMAEVKLFADSFSANVTFIHVGTPDEQQKKLFNRLLNKYDYQPDKIKVIFESGSVHETIDDIADENNCDLIITGALKKEGYRKRYFGSIARNLARNAHTPVMLIPEAELPVKPVQKIIVAINDENPRPIIETGIFFAKHIKGSKLILVKESALHGSKFSLSQFYTDENISRAHEKLVDCETDYLDEIMQYFDTEGIEIHRKVVFGHSGIALVEYANQVKADLLIDAFPDFRLGILDRIFPHDVEYALLDLPCKLLLVNK